MPSEWEKEMARLKWWLSEDYQKGVPMPYTGGLLRAENEEEKEEE
jgi:hypothetical protein